MSYITIFLHWAQEHAVHLSILLKILYPFCFWIKIDFCASVACFFLRRNLSRFYRNASQLPAGAAYSALPFLAQRRIKPGPFKPELKIADLGSRRRFKTEPGYGIPRNQIKMTIQPPRKIDSLLRRLGRGINTAHKGQLQGSPPRRLCIKVPNCLF